MIFSSISNELLDITLPVKFFFKSAFSWKRAKSTLGALKIPIFSFFWLNSTKMMATKFLRVLTCVLCVFCLFWLILGIYVCFWGFQISNFSSPVKPHFFGIRIFFLRFFARFQYFYTFARRFLGTSQAWPRISVFWRIFRVFWKYFLIFFVDFMINFAF